MKLTPEQARALQAKRLREPIDFRPFLVWCVLRERAITREIDRSTLQIRGDKGNNSHSAARPDSPSGRLLDEIGWDRESGARRLFRWCNEPSTSGQVERAVIEDALHHAGVDFYDVYPDLEPDVTSLRDGYCLACRDDVTTADGRCPWCDGEVDARRPHGSHARMGAGCRMTDAQVRAAHVIYQQRGLNLNELGMLLHERFGYATHKSCGIALRRAFIRLGLPRRDGTIDSTRAHITHGLLVGGPAAKTSPEYLAWRRERKRLANGVCTATKSDGSPCDRAALTGQQTCGFHRPEEVERRRAIIAQLNAAGKNRLGWQRRAERQAA